MMNETEKSAATAEEIRALKQQMEEMQKRLEALCSSTPDDPLCACDEREEASGVGEASAAMAGEAFGSAAVETGASLKEPIVLEIPADSASGVVSGNPAAFVEPVDTVGDAAFDGSATRADAGAFDGSEGFAASAAPDVAAACTGVGGPGAALPQVPDHGQSVAACSPYVAPVATESASVAAPAGFGKGSPTPPPAYDAHAFQQGFYAQPTGQQAPYSTPAQAPYGPYGKGPYQQPVVRTKDHVAAGLLGIFLGSLGVHKFYLGYNTPGFIMLGVSILGGLLSFGIASSVVWLIGLIEGVIYLVKGQPEFERLYVFGKRDWF